MDSTHNYALYIHPDIKKAAQVKCVETDNKLNRVINGLLEAWVKNPTILPVRYPTTAALPAQKRGARKQAAAQAEKG